MLKSSIFLIIFESPTKKTGALISVAVESGAIMGGANEFELNSLLAFARELGILFQLVDDIMDVVGDREIMGKPVGSDVQNNKETIVSLVGLHKAEQLAETSARKAKSWLIKIHRDTSFLEDLVDIMRYRRR